jgi:hypothetical protein
MRLPGFVAVLALLASAIGTSAARAEPTRESDLDLARTRYVEQGRSFSVDERRQALEFIDRERGCVGRMSDEEFLLTMLRIAAFADNAHDVLNEEPGAWFPSARLPLRLVWFPDGWVVARVAPELADLAGARVRTIEGLAPEAMLEKLRPLAGGIDSYRLWNLVWIIENAGLLHALGVAKSPDGLTLAADLKDGSRVERFVRFVPKAEQPRAAPATRLLMPAAWASERERRWRYAPVAPLPLYLDDADRLYRRVRLRELDALYLQFRLHLDSREEKLAAFTATVDADIARLAPMNLIVDLRFDTGGNDGGAKVTVVGEPVGDRLGFWSEGVDICLPKSHYCLHRTTGQWNLERGCAGVEGCYGDAYEVTVGSLTPDLPAPLTASTWLAGRDAALDAIRVDLGSRRRPNQD